MAERTEFIDTRSHKAVRIEPAIAGRLSIKGGEIATRSNPYEPAAGCRTPSSCSYCQPACEPRKMWLWVGCVLPWDGSGRPDQFSHAVVAP